MGKLRKVATLMIGLSSLVLMSVFSELSFAKYVSDDSQNVNADIAQFDVYVENISSSLSITGGHDGNHPATLTFDVVSKSEVKIGYQIIVNMTKGIIHGLSLNVDGVTMVSAPEIGTNGYKTSTTYYLEPNDFESKNSHDLKFITNDNNRTDPYEASRLEGIQISLYAFQVL